MATTIEEVLDLIKKDPVKGFVMVAVAAAQSPNPAIIVQAKGRDLKLPDWTGSEWAWYGSLAQQIASRTAKSIAALAVASPSNPVPIVSIDQLFKSGEAAKLVGDLRKAQENLDGHLDTMRSLGSDKPSPPNALEIYTLSVKCVIAASAAIFALKNRTGAIEGVVEAYKEALREAPQSIGNFIASILQGGKTILVPVAKAAADILSELFAVVASSGIGIVLLVIGGLYLWSKSRSSKEGE